MRKYTRRLAVPLAVIALVVGSAGVASADNAVGDGDGAVPLSTNNLNFGPTVCLGSTTTKDVALGVIRAGGGTNAFKNGAIVTLSVTGITGSGLSATLGTPTTITLPGDWTSSANGTTSPTAATARVTLSAATLGPVSGTLSFQASGANTSNATINRGGTVTVTATVVNCDTTPPTLSLPTGLTYEANSSAGAVATWTATAADASPASPAVTCSPTSGSTFALGTTAVSCSATDASGNTATGSFNVTVDDTTPPTIGQPADVEVEAVSSAGATVSYTTPAATDVVDGAVTATCLPASGSMIALGATTVTCAATDAHGNAATTGFTITVADGTAPQLTVPTYVTTEATGPSGAPVAFTATATDTVDADVTVTCVPPSGSTFPLGDTAVSCTGVDDSGNPTAGEFTVSVVDTTAPTVTVPAAIVVEATGPTGAETSFIVTASDVVDGNLPVTCTPASGDLFPIGSTAVECSATDAAGNTGTAVFGVTVVDTTAPALHLPADITMEATGPETLVAFAVTAADAVTLDPTVTCTPMSGSGFIVGDHTVHCEATDTVGNTSTGDFSVTIQDTTAPELTLPSDDVVAEATGAEGAAVTFEATASDLVDDDLSVSCDVPSGSVFALGDTVVTCSASDEAGNSTEASFTVRVEDTTPPAIGALTGLSAEAVSAAGVELTYDTPSAVDLVDSDPSVACVPPSGSTFPLGDSTVTCTATDDAGNSSEADFSVTVADTTSPLLSLPDSVEVEATSPSGAIATWEGTADDLVDGAVPVACNPVSGGTFALGDTPITCDASDSRGNTTSGSFSVSVVDTTPPTLTMPADQTVEATGPNGAIGTFAATATDIVDGDVLASCDADSGSTFPLGTTTVACTASDTRGNTTTESFTITVQDTTAPELVVPADFTVEATGPNGAPVDYQASATDVVDGDVTPTCSPLPGTFALGTTTVTCTASDTRHHSATASFTVTVHDTTPPALNLSDDIATEATSAAGASVDYGAAASDLVDGLIGVDCTPSSGTTFALGTTTVHCTATDQAGNGASGSFTVQVVDTTGPAISGTPADLEYEATGPDGATVTYTSPAATDIVDGTVPVTCMPPSGSIFELDATTTVTCTATDQAGNNGGADFSITVSDTTVPTIILPSDITAEATSASGAAVAFAPSATDVVDGSIAVTCTPDSGSMFPLGTTTVACSAQDAHDNATNGSFDVIVVDTTAPTLTLPANITREATGPAGATAAFITAADDAVAGTLAVTCDATSGSMFPLGTTTVHCSAADDAGNTTSGVFTVTVNDTTAPVVTVPSNLSLTATGSNGALATYSATASDQVTGPIPPACTPPSGSTFLPGTTTVTCTATDGAGNVASRTFTVTVTFDVAGGLLPPVNPNPAVRNTVKGGSTVPVKWQVRNPEGGFISNLNIVAGFSITRLSCSSMAPVADPVEITTTGGTVLRYAGDQFIQNWQTPKSPGFCYRLAVTLTDGTVLTASFELK